MRKRLIAGISGATVLLLGAPAFAEGSWTSYITGALTGFDSRTWTDRNSDNVGTTITFRGCRDENPYTTDNVEVQLTRQTPWYEPDENRGRKTLYCGAGATDTKNWGDQPSSSYHFTITKINGSTSGHRVDVSYVRVAY